MLGSIEPPHTTRAFGITQAPQNHQDPLTTQTPGTTQAPQATQEPLNTQTPVTTQSPGTTQDPLTTKTPVTTQAPQTTQEPLNTQMPVITQAPQSVEGPEIQLTLYIGQNKTIFCPVSNFKWLYNNGKKDLPDGVVPDGINSLRITSVNKSHEGTFTCVGQTNSSNFGSAAHIVLQVIYPETCSRVKANISDASDWYIIDPDGPGGKAPFQAYCNMTDKEGAGVTVVSHDSENRTHVDGCDPQGCYKRDVSYTGVLITQLDALTDVSARCEQFISYECFNSRLLEGGKAWWVSRDGRKMDYWGGTTEKRQCSCALTDSCAHRDKKCNCDYRDNTWHEDSGLLTEKAFLPVSQLRFGDTGKDISEGYHTLGKLKCYGMSTSHHQ